MLLPKAFLSLIGLLLELRSGLSHDHAALMLESEPLGGERLLRPLCGRHLWAQALARASGLCHSAPLCSGGLVGPPDADERRQACPDDVLTTPVFVWAGCVQEAVKLSAHAALHQLLDGLCTALLRQQLTVQLAQEARSLQTEPLLPSEHLFNVHPQLMVMLSVSELSQESAGPGPIRLNMCKLLGHVVACRGNLFGPIQELGPEAFVAAKT
mmetsp:Transcript_75140/g.220220  ORF Transcript_75140/g.220220 Transcript_75140/m.220220 type:complete len:212 (-) Transcript_75140:1710-2345(-)